MENEKTQSDASPARQIQLAIVDFALTALGLAVIALGTWAVWKENLPLAGTALGAGLVLLFGATIDRFESLKGLGMEAKTRRLKASIDQAEALTAQLNELVDFVGTNLIVLTSSMGRWADAPPILQAYDQAQQVKRMMEKVDIDTRKIHQTLTPWAKTVAFDAAGAIRHEIQIELRKSLDALRQELIKPSSDNSEIRQRIAAIEAFQAVRYPGADKWSMSEIIEEIGRQPHVAPELPDSRRAEIRSKAAALQVQLRYLAEHMDFKDLDFWARFRRAHELEAGV